MFFNEETFFENHQQISAEKSTLDLKFTECHGDFFGPALPPHFSKVNSEGKEKKTMYGPSLPNHFKEEKKDELNELSLPVQKRNNSILIGPEIPKYLSPELKSPEIEEDLEPALIDVNFGPSTTLMATENATEKFLNTQNLHKKIVNVGTSNIKRESWMTELPEKKKPTFGLFQRHFKSQTQTEKEGDSSVWTDTPADKKEKEFNINKKDHNEILKIKRLEERDKEMEKLAERSAKKLKKEESLMEIHLKRMKKKKRKESKKQKKERALLPERRPFDRNVDLQICKYDKSQIRANLNRNHFLKDRFAPGQSRFL